jgi:uncharacterized damage-inducible protein DinB
MVEDMKDSEREEPAYVASERGMLEAWLEFHRRTLFLKCDGLDTEALKARPVPTSKLSLHGLVRHMADVERNWFTRVLLSAPGTPPLFFVMGVDDDRELFPLDDADWALDLGAWRSECDLSRQNAARFDLDHIGTRRGKDVSLRWIYNHMVEEYARHNGHADLIREMVDGAVGW